MAEMNIAIWDDSSFNLKNSMDTFFWKWGGSIPFPL